MEHTFDPDLGEPVIHVGDDIVKSPAPRANSHETSSEPDILEQIQSLKDPKHLSELRSRRESKLKELSEIEHGIKLVETATGVVHPAAPEPNGTPTTRSRKIPAVDLTPASAPIADTPAPIKRRGRPAGSKNTKASEKPAKAETPDASVPPKRGPGRPKKNA